MFKKIFYKKPYIIGIHPSCPDCKESYLSSKELDRKKSKKRTDIYMECKCGCKYRYHLGR